MESASKFTQFTDLTTGLNEAPPPPPKTKWSAKEVEQIRSDAFAEGQQSSEAQAAQQAAAAIERIAQSCEALYSRIAHLALQHKSHASQLAHIIGKKIAAAALASYPEAEILEVIESCLPHLSDEPRIHLTVPTQLRETIAELLKETVERLKLEVEIELHVSDDLDASDCTLKWSNGGIERNREDIEQEIERIIEDKLSADEQTEMQLDLFGNE